MDHTANGGGRGADRSTPRTVQLSVPRAAAGRPTEPAPLLGCVWLTPHPAARCDARPSSRQFNASKCAGGGEKCAEACRALTNTSYYMGHRPGPPGALGSVGLLVSLQGQGVGLLVNIPGRAASESPKRAKSERRVGIPTAEPNASVYAIPPRDSETPPPQKALSFEFKVLCGLRWDCEKCS